MQKNQRRNVKVKIEPPTLDLEEFNSLTDLLFELLKEKHAGCARMLGISRQTWRKWEKEPPTWPYWNLVLRTVIKQYLTALRGKRGMTGSHRSRIMKALAEVPNAEDFMADIDQEAYQIAGSAAHLRTLLAPGGMWLDDILKPANCGGYNEKALRRGARQLGVVKTQEGYGGRKRARWRLPDQDDD